MAGNQRDVVVRFVGDYKSLGDGADKVTGRLQTVATSLKGIATAGAAVAAGAFLRDAITQASNLQEATSKTSVIFGRSAGDIVKYSEDAADAIGQSQVAAMDAASTFATFGKAAGLTGSELSTFSTELVTLSSDLASFHNATPEETVEALGAALRGEAEPIQRFGVLLNDATLREEALAQGLIKTTKEALTPQQKVLAAQGVVMKQTVDAQGDFQRTSEGLANSQRTLAARTADAAAELGQKFLPISQTITHALADGVLPAVVNVGGAIADVLVPVVETAWAAGSKLAETWGNLPDPIQNAAIAMGVWALVGDRVTGSLGGMRSGMSGFGDDVRTAMGAFEVGRVQGTFMALEERVPAIGQMGAAFRGARGDVTGFGSAMKGLGAVGLTGFKAAASGVMGILGGPFGFALTAVTFGLSAFAGRNREAEERQRKLAGASKDVAKVLQEEANALNARTRQAAAAALEEGGMLELAEKNRINTSRLTDAYLGNNDARKDVNASIRGQIDALRAQEAAQLKAYENGDELASRDLATTRRKISGLQEVQVAIDGAIGTRENETAAIERTTAAQREEIAAKDGVAGSTSRLMGSEESFQAVLAETGLEYDANKSRLENLLAALQNYNNEVIGAVDSEEAWFASLDALNQSVVANGTSLDIHTQKGRENRDALQDLSAKTKQLYLDNIQAGMSVEDATKIYDQNMHQVYATAGALGFNEKEARRLINTYGGIPKKIVTEFQTKGYDATWAKLNQLSAGQILGEKGMPVTPANVRAVQKDLKMGRYAHGGPVIGYGTGTSDDNLALLSNNEHVWTAREVRAAGGHGRVEALRQAVVSGFLPGFAKGGAVTWPQTVNVSKFKIPDPFAAALAAASRGGGGGGAQQWAPLVLQVLRMLGQSASLLPNVLRRMNQESGGNPRAINNWDSNAKKGTPSIGLMQTIGPTFNRWAGPFRARGIYDPLANIYAGLNYAIHRYPSLQYAMDKPGGYDGGGWLRPGESGVNGLRKPEAVLTPEESAAYKSLAKNAASGQVGSKVEKHYHFTMQTRNYPVDVATQFARMEAMAGL